MIGEAERRVPGSGKGWVEPFPLPFILGTPMQKQEHVPRLQQVK